MLWKQTFKEPWLLATNVHCPALALRLYSRRMWTEMFGDLKKHGFDLESTHLQHFLRLSRLTLTICLLLIGLVALGQHVLANALSAQVDQTDHYDLSIFRL